MSCSFLGKYYNTIKDNNIKLPECFVADIGSRKVNIMGTASGYFAIVPGIKAPTTLIERIDWVRVTCGFNIIEDPHISYENGFIFFHGDIKQSGFESDRIVIIGQVDLIEVWSELVWEHLMNYVPTYELNLVLSKFGVRFLG